MNSEFGSFQRIFEMQKISAFPFLVSDALTVKPKTLQMEEIPCG